jgi:hypothetical protein
MLTRLLLALPQHTEGTTVSQENSTTVSQSSTITLSKPGQCIHAVGFTRIQEEPILPIKVGSTAQHCWQPCALLHSRGPGHHLPFLLV